MNVKLYYSLATGIATYIPGLRNIVSRLDQRFLASGSTGGANSAKYCYSVWLRHLTMAYANNLPTLPTVVAEVGPGNSLGIGLAALLSGATKYYAFDIVKFSNIRKNLEVFYELVDLFKRRENIPYAEFTNVKPNLSSYEFPSQILSEHRLNETLKQSRIQAIEKAITGSNNDNTRDIQIFYYVPWYDSAIIKNESVDMILSQAVLEHVDNLPYIYEALYEWLKPGGFMSHQIDFRSHITAKEWNGHWTYSDSLWRLMKGRRPYLINRQPNSMHVNLARKAGFEIVCHIKCKDRSRIDRNRLASRFKKMSHDDLITSGAFIQAIKKQ